MINTPTEVDHYQLFRIIDVYVSPRGEDLGTLLKKVQHVIGDTKLPPNTRVQLRGSVVAMNDSFKSFAIGLSLSVVLVYLILMAQFASFSDPFIILLAVPPGVHGRHPVPADNPHQHQHHVADGSDDDDRHRGLRFDPHRGVHARTSAARRGTATRRFRMPATSVCGPS